MKKLLLALSVTALSACHNESGYKAAEDAQDAAREFIRASLDGDYPKAVFYLYKDSADVNQRLLDKWKKDYDKLSAEDKVGYKEANIIVINTSPAGDSSLNYIYSNTYKKDTTTIRIVKSGGAWLVDLKDIH
jgi:hypothetical protein